MNLILIGVMGSGKSTIGRLSAKELSMEFVDMDIFLEEHYNRTIDSFFSEGENVFRDAETAVAQILGKQDRTVISTGGGVVLREDTMKALKENGITIFLDRNLDEIIERVNHENRPLLRDHPEKLYEIMEKRRNLYEKYADYTVINNQNLEDIVKQVASLWRKEGF